MPPRNQTVCFVLGLESQIGLGIVRELGRAGIPVIGISRNSRALALASRFLLDRILIDGRTEESIDSIRRVGDQYGGGVLIAISDPDLAWLAKYQESLGSVTPILPPKAAFETALNKKRTIEIARQLGIRVPQTVEVKNDSDIETIAETVRFPVVLKWQDPQAVSSALHALGMELIKAEYIYDRSALTESLARYCLLGQWPLIQEYCPGHGLGQFFYIHRGQAIRRFQHRRICEWPPEGGFSSVCEAVPLHQHRDLQEQSIALLNQLGWEGVAMVEYRYDPEQQQAILMEVNGRYWGSFPLAVQCRAGFAVISYLLHTTGNSPELPPALEHVRCRNVATEIKRLAVILTKASSIRDRNFRVKPVAEIWRFFADFFRPNVGFFVWSWDDPAPFFSDIRNSVASLIKKFSR
jgi:predicted ATP-grasp superfamily ATP-dependent carboligase